MKIKIEVDGLTLEHATELTKFLSSLRKETDNGVYNEIKKASEEMNERASKLVIPEENIPTPVKLTRKKAEKVEAPQDEETSERAEAIDSIAEAKQAENITAVEAETVTAPTLMQIRSLVAQKAGEHKDSIKAKLVEMGAQNVSTLDAKHFQTIFAFLNEL